MPPIFQIGVHENSPGMDQGMTKRLPLQPAEHSICHFPNVPKSKDRREKGRPDGINTNNHDGVIGCSFYAVRSGSKKPQPNYHHEHHDGHPPLFGKRDKGNRC